MLMMEVVWLRGWEELCRACRVGQVNTDQRRGTTYENADQSNAAYLKQCPKNCEMIERDTASLMKLMKLMDDGWKK